MTAAKRFALAALLTTAFAAAPTHGADYGSGPAARHTVGEKPFGLLLLGEGGDRDWRALIDEAKKRAGKGYPLVFAAGKADRKEMQKGIDLLQAQRVKTIVVVPLFVSTYGESMDQVRFLLGIRETPAKEAPGARPRRDSELLRLKSRVPLVLTKALDDHPLFVELLAARAQTLSRKASEEALVLVGQGPADKEAAAEWEQAEGALAEKVRQKGGFAAARAWRLTPDAKPLDREAAVSGLQNLVRELRRTHGKVIVVPLAMSTGDAKPLRLEQALDGLFAKHDGKTIIPDARIPQWIEASALPASKLPDMRLFKDSGKAGVVPEGMKHQGIAAPPALPKPGEKRQ